MTDTANILDMNEDELLAQFKARDTLIESLRQQLAECQAREKVLREHFKDCKCQPMLYMPSDSTALYTLKKQWQREALLERADYYDSIPGYEAFGGTIADELREKAKELE